MRRLLLILLISSFCLGIFLVVLFGLILFAKEYENPIVYEDTIRKYSCIYDVDVCVVFAVIKAESNFNESALSKKGAQGLMQIMPNTAKYIAVKLGEDTQNIDLYEAETNIRYGIWYISYLNKIFDNNLTLVAASYNAGEGNVRNWLAKFDNCLEICDIPFYETREYVEKVLRYYAMYKNSYFP
ncbi:MAG: lytic transglycosylase domain-containing protein [Firmicutes bacterium]|nr:lytic transglycosylase domain-containing protein [Bacillota bacterium]